MGIFNKKTAQPDMPIEVVVSKDSTQEAVLAAKEANKHLNDLLVENGFTLKIWVAAGGKHKGKRK